MKVHTGTKSLNEVLQVQAECNQLYLRFESPKDENAIKELDSRIQTVEFKKENTR